MKLIIVAGVVALAGTLIGTRAFIGFLVRRFAFTELLVARFEQAIRFFRQLTPDAGQLRHGASAQGSSFSILLRAQPGQQTPCMEPVQQLPNHSSAQHPPTQAFAQGKPPPDGAARCGAQNPCQRAPNHESVVLCEAVGLSTAVPVKR